MQFRAAAFKLYELSPPLELQFCPCPLPTSHPPHHRGATQPGRGHPSSSSRCGLAQLRFSVAWLGSAQQGGLHPPQLQCLQPWPHCGSRLCAHCTGLPEVQQPIDRTCPRLLTPTSPHKAAMDPAPCKCLAHGAPVLLPP